GAVTGGVVAEPSGDALAGLDGLDLLGQLVGGVKGGRGRVLVRVGGGDRVAIRVIGDADRGERRAARVQVRRADLMACLVVTGGDRRAGGAAGGAGLGGLGELAGQVVGVAGGALQGVGGAGPLARGVVRGSAGFAVGCG